MIIEFFTIHVSVRLSDRSEVTQHKINFVKNCPQCGLNSQPSDHQSHALPLEFFLNYQEHKNDRSGNYVFPYFLFVKFVTDTRKSRGMCCYNFLLIIGIKRTDMSRNKQGNNI